MTGGASTRCVARTMTLVAAVCCLPLAAWSQPSAPYWGSHGRNAQHTALADVATQPLARIRWQTPVDARPDYLGDLLPIHYGSPLVTQANTVVVPLKARHTSTFRVVAFDGSTGRKLWRQSSNYKL